MFLPGEPKTHLFPHHFSRPYKKEGQGECTF